MINTLFMYKLQRAIEQSVVVVKECANIDQHLLQAVATLIQALPTSQNIVQALQDVKSTIKLEMLLNAAYTNNINLIKLALISGWDVNSADKNGVTMLHIAAYNNHTDIMQLLLAQSSINVNCTIINPTETGMQQGMTPLHMSVIKNHSDATSVFMQRFQDKGDVDLSRTFNDGATVLHAAAYSDNMIAMIIILSVPGVNTNPSTESGITPWHVAAFWGRYRVLELTKTQGGEAIPLDENISISAPLLANGKINLNAPDINGASPLFYAIAGWGRSSVRDEFTDQTIFAEYFKDWQILIALQLTNYEIFARYLFIESLKSLLTNPNVNINHKMRNLDVLTLMLQTEATDSFIEILLQNRPELRADIETLTVLLSRTLSADVKEIIRIKIAENKKLEDEMKAVKIEGEATGEEEASNSTKQEFKMKDAQKMIQDISRKAHATLGLQASGEGMSAANAQATFEQGDPHTFPDILRQGMKLKQKGHPAADEIIKKIIIKMAEADKSFHNFYKQEVDLILDTEFAGVADTAEATGHPLLRDAVREIDNVAPYKYSRTLLHKAAFELRSEIIKLLCEGGADVDKMDENGWSALTIAMNAPTKNSDALKETVKTLFDYNPDIYVGTSYNQPMEHAVHDLSLWSQLFTEYAHTHKVVSGIKAVDTPTRVQVASACHDGADIKQLMDFYHEMGWDMSTLGKTFFMDM